LRGVGVSYLFFSPGITVSWSWSGEKIAFPGYRTSLRTAKVDANPDEAKHGQLKSKEEYEFDPGKRDLLGLACG
jgi:hypothetical protein